MSRFIFLLILLLFFMTSCNIEKSSIHTLSPDKIQVQEKELPNEFTGSGITKDYWNDFTLSQTDNETTLSYSGIIIKSWSHTPPEKIPFTWDEACTIVWNWFEKLTSENQSTGKQWVWDALAEKEKKECMKEYFWWNTIDITSINERFYKISRSYYEWYDLWIYDIKSWNLQDITSMGEPSIEITNTGILLKVEYDYGDDRSPIINEYLYDPNFKTLISDSYQIK